MQGWSPRQERSHSGRSGPLLDEIFITIDQTLSFIDQTLCLAPLVKKVVRRESAAGRLDHAAPRHPNMGVGVAGRRR